MQKRSAKLQKKHGIIIANIICFVGEWTMIGKCCRGSEKKSPLYACFFCEGVVFSQNMMRKRSVWVRMLFVG